MATNPLQGNCIIEMQQRLEERLQDARSTAHRARDEFTIFRVPEHLRGVSPEDYEPKLVSIGPFHRGKDRLRSMEAHKLHLLNLFLQRNKSLNLNVCINSMRSLEEEARNCYSENFEMSSDQFVEMMLLDSCFIVELLLQMLIDHHDDDYPIVGTQYTKFIVFEDMLLLENQLPFFIILKLVDLVGCRHIPFVGDLFVTFLQRNALLIGCQMPSADFVPDHILHLFKYWLEVQQQSEKSKDSEAHEASCCKVFSCFDRKPNPASYELAKPPSATELHECGAKFKIADEGSFLDVKICDGTIQMPRLEIEDRTLQLLRNLIALEQGNKKFGSRLTSYAFFMTRVVRSPMDVALLEEKGVLLHYLGNDKDVCHLLSNLGKNVYFDEGRELYLRGVTLEMCNYCHSRRNRWRAILSRDYFGNPWSLISLLAATVLLVLTFLQTIFTIIQ